MAQTNEIIESFLKHYEQGYDFYYNLAKLAEEQCEKMLSKDIRAIITSRAKKSKSLKEKIYQRHKIKNYQSEQDIREDIVDLAGVRVALYFPADREKVDGFLRDIFHIVKEVSFPKSDKQNKEVSINNKFDGYHAEHYRVKLKEESLKDSKYANHIIEIQVASILMHAWAEVNHDLAYKPSSGDLSRQELSILDGLNGLVLTGEVLLEQLQSAFQNRVAHQKEPFANQYEFAEFINQILRDLYNLDENIDLPMDEIDFLLTFLNEISLNSPDDFRALLYRKLDRDIIQYPLLFQVLDLVFERNIEKFEIYYEHSMYYSEDNGEEARDELRKILIKKLLLQRYIRCLAHYRNVQDDDLLVKAALLEGLGYPPVFVCIVDWIVIADEYIHSYFIHGLFDLLKKWETEFDVVEKLDDKDSQKAMEWARSSQLKLPEK